MSLDGNAKSTSVLRGTIHNLIIDKTLSISGAAADSKAVADAIAAVSGVEVVIPVERGGTGATDAATARANLGASAVGHTHTPASIGAASASHTHTASDVGAAPIIDANSASYDMDAIIKNKSLSGNIYKTGSATLGTPYAKGVSNAADAIILNISSSVNYGAQFAFSSGGNGVNLMFWRTLRGGVISDWTTGFLPLAGGTLTGDLTVEKTDDTVMIGIANSNRKVVFQLSSSNNAGIYDATNNKWLIYHDGANNRLMTAIAPNPNDVSLRSIQGGTSDTTAGSSSLTTGQLYVVYE